MNEKEPNECVIVAWIESKSTCTAVMQINQFIHEQNKTHRHVWPEAAEDWSVRGLQHELEQLKTGATKD